MAGRGVYAGAQHQKVLEFSIKSARTASVCKAPDEAPTPLMQLTPVEFRTWFTKTVQWTGGDITDEMNDVLYSDPLDFYARWFILSELSQQQAFQQAIQAGKICVFGESSAFEWIVKGEDKNAA